MNESMIIDLDQNDLTTIGNNDNNSMTDMFNTTEHWYLYLGPYLLEFRDEYIKIHGWISIAVCLFGIIANILNIIVLTRKEMISPTNFILTGLAVADCLVMMSYTPYSIHQYIRLVVLEERFSFGWAVFTLFHAHFTVVCHTISTWLTVILAIWRYLAVSFPTDSKAWCNMVHARYAVFITYITCVFLLLPTYFSFTIKRNVVYEFGRNHTLYQVDFSQLTKDYTWLRDLNFYGYGIMLKVIPCILLTYLSFALIKVLYQANQRRQRLKHGVDYSTVVSSNFSQNLVVNNSQSCDRTTRMLVAILIMFLIAEIPNGTVALLSGIYSDEFHMVVYNNLGEVLDMLALFNSAINFILYCTMSRQFRKVFVKLFCTTVIVASEPANHLMTNHHHNKHKRQSQPLVDPHTCQTTFV